MTETKKMVSSTGTTNRASPSRDNSELNPFAQGPFIYKLTSLVENSGLNQWLYINNHTHTHTQTHTYMFINLLKKQVELIGVTLFFILGGGLFILAQYVQRKQLIAAEEMMMMMMREPRF